MKRTLLALVLAVPFLTWASPAHADGCASHGEYDNLEWGLTTTQVANRFDTSGWTMGLTDDGDFFKRGYDTCWAADRKIVVWYSVSLGVSDHWDVRDR